MDIMSDILLYGGAIVPILMISEALSSSTTLVVLGAGARGEQM